MKFISMITRITKRLLTYGYLLKSINWLKLYKSHKKNSDNVILIYITNPIDYFSYFFSAGLVNDVALVRSLIPKLKDFRLCISGKKLLTVSDKNIYMNLSKRFTFYEGENYSESLLNFQNALIDNNNKIFPSNDSSKYWENKIYMHEKFIDLDISHPRTIVVNKDNPPPIKPQIDFPILFKPAHASGSIGIVKIDNLSQYEKIIRDNEYDDYLLQQWIDMKRDLRLIYVGDELVVHYWRINESDDWRPTSTGRGSSVDFETLPDLWMDFIFKEYKKLNIHAGAFDITWHKDDLTLKPLILEVSPSFMPNPSPTNKYVNLPYKEFKKVIFGKDAYYKQYIDLVFNITDKLVKQYEQTYKS